MSQAIGIDIRTLMIPVRTGIGEYTFELLNAIFKLDSTREYYLFYNAYKQSTSNLALWNQPNVHYIDTHYPNKLLNTTLRFTRLPKLDQLIIKKVKIPKLDLFFSPHLNFTTLSKNTKHILTIHDLSFEFFPHFFSKKQRLWHTLIEPHLQAKNANIIITPSINSKQDLVTYYLLPEKKIKVIYPGLSIKNQQDEPNKLIEIKQKYNLPDNIILFLGTNEPRKNIVGLIKAFELTHAHLPQNYTLVIAGSNGWNNREMYEHIKYSPLKNSIKILGYIEDQEKRYLYKISSLFIYPSFYEGFGFPVLEAMAAGTPVITSDRSSLPEITDQHAYLINPHKPTSIAEGMQVILSNEKIRSTLINGGLEQSKKFNWKTAAEDWLKLVEEK
jgi:glycosyltransferase involved in cell wall biosynthesis